MKPSRTDAGLTPEQKSVVQALQDGIPVVEKPFRLLAEKTHMSEDDFLDCLRYLCKEGFVRRLGATLQHQTSGYPANAMIAWRVDEQRIEHVGTVMASFHNVTHCYHRQTVPEWPYNVYTMVHGKTEEECYDVAERIAQRTGLTDYQLLFSHRELKRSNVRYFKED